MKLLPLRTTVSVLLFILQTLCLTPSFAAKKSYVVYLGEHEHASEQLDVDHEQVKEGHFDFLESFVGSRELAEESIFYSYTRHINGFAATLDEAIASEIAKHPNVVSMFLNKGKKLHTTRSWHFMDLEQNGVVPSYSIWKKARFGEDTIIGNLDSGVWPESKSFADDGLGPIPSRWKGRCKKGSDPSFRCNRKLIGAKFFNKGWLAGGGTTLNSSTNSPRDVDGHGTHTLSTAGGGFVPNASVFGFGNGTAKGGSPRARVAAYRVCFPPVNESECFDSDVLAAFDAAIADGVDVLSVSLGSEAVPFFEDTVAIGAFHAAKRGIVVVCSAGNSGPDVGSVSNVAPWQFTVGASTMDRQFPSYVVLGNNKTYMGQSLSPKTLANKFFPIISALHAKAANATDRDALLCKPRALDPQKASGKILVCLRGVNPRVDKGQQASLVGAVGMVLANNETNGNEVLADAHVLPASHVNYSDGVSIFKYVNSTRFAVAYITSPTTQLNTKPAPVMAAFSSKGPNSITPEILKPDITAPGVSVLAAYTGAVGPTGQEFDKRRVNYNVLSGTSMSCPEMAGIVGLLKTLYPSWSPAAIKSAIMTTAITIDNSAESILNATNKAADPFTYGAGHVRPNQAMDPGLVYDLKIRDYFAFLCALNYNRSKLQQFSKSSKCPEKPISFVNFNYPAITLPQFNRSITVSRTVTNVGTPATYRPVVKSPRGISTVVRPGRLDFTRVGQKKSFNVTFKGVKRFARQTFRFGYLIWTDSHHHVRIPLVVKW